MKVWVTKYALTGGIEELEVEKSRTDRMVCQHLGINIRCIHKPFWHETREAALAHAIELKDRKIKSLEKQIRKIRAIDFELNLE